MLETALRMRHPQFGVNRDQPRRHSAEARKAILIRGKGKKERYVPFGDSVKSALRVVSP